MCEVTRAGDHFAALIEGRCDDPFALLGPHLGDVVVLLPGASAVSVLRRSDREEIGTLQSLDSRGLFAGPVPTETPYVLRIDWPGRVEETEDPYAFGPLLAAQDLELIATGRHRHLAACLGAHSMTIDGVAGTRFAVWAPNARRVSVVGDFNAWDGRRHPMRRRLEAGVWEIFIPRVAPGALYKYEILGPDWAMLPLKADPVALQAEPVSATASVVSDPTPFPWSDAAWLAARPKRQAIGAPIAIYEVHAGSWMQAEGHGLNWLDLADRLIPYAVGMGFSHIELLPIMNHPFGGSWGYQPLGLFAPMSTFGPPDMFAEFIDRCHAFGLGVILDWVPAHFPGDAHGLVRFDGTALYEHSDPRQGLHRGWNTLIYNYGRHEVRGFLIANALYWLEHYHLDGLRVDAVSSMLYLDYGREPGDWLPNARGGRENLDAVAFLQELNATIAERCPGALVIAEESTAWPGVTAPIGDPTSSSLGFSLKWNMGWMHDTLDYFAEQPVYRKYHHNKITFGMMYFYSEYFLLPLSHDEVVYGKGSLLEKMPGDRWQKFANLRAYLAFMWTYPGQKLLFMGGEFAQAREWNHDRSLDWHLLDDPAHRGVQLLVRDLNRQHRDTPALHARDAFPDGFRWLVVDDRERSVFAFLRVADAKAGAAGTALVICNFTPVPRENYRVGTPTAGGWAERLNTDAVVYGGGGIGNGGFVAASDIPWGGWPASILLTLPPLATLILIPEAVA